MKKVVFWDFDGTLSHPNASFATALADAAADLGCTIDRTRATSFLSSAYSWKHPDVTYANAVLEAWWEDLYAKISDFCEGEGVAADKLGDINKRVRKRLTDINNYRVYEDAFASLARCRRAGFVNCLLTNNYPEIVSNVKKLGLAEHIDFFVVSSHIGFEKPKSELFEYAKQLTGAGDDCFMIGDNPVADIEGGKLAGLKTFFVHNGFLATADVCADTLAEAVDIILNEKNPKVD